MTKRIRIFFINCPTLAIDATSFLILAQNRVQTALQFEVHRFWLYSRNSKGELEGYWNKFLSRNEDSFHSNSPWRERKYRTKLDLRVAPFFSDTIPLKTDKWATVKAIIKGYDDWLKGSGYNTYDFNNNDPVLIITETPLFGKYISLSTEGIGILGAADWKDFMGSGSASALEYILTGVQRLSLRLSYGAVIGSHFSTRGCLWDFNVHQPDVKIGSFLGYLCEVCRQGLKRTATTEEFEDITKLISNDWIGEESKSDSIAGILKKDYKYSLNRSTGLRPGFMSLIKDSMPSEIGKFVVKAIITVIAFLFTFFLLTYFPDAIDKWKKLISIDSPAKVESKVNSNTNVPMTESDNNINANSVNTP